MAHQSDDHPMIFNGWASLCNVDPNELLMGQVGLSWVGLIYRKVKTGGDRSGTIKGKGGSMYWALGAGATLNLKILYEFHLIRIIPFRSP